MKIKRTKNNNFYITLNDKPHEINARISVLLVTVKSGHTGALITILHDSMTKVRFLIDFYE